MAVITHLETDTGTNVDISGATAVGAYTANGDKLIMVDVSIDAVAGNGDYIMYVTRQIGGSGSAYRILPQTTMTAASGLTAISGQSGWITVRNGDVLTCYVDGLAGDTSTPDWSTRWFESAVTLVTLADDAITASKFDESTAYPLKSADTGSTQVARVGADSDTLETLSDEIAAVKAETALIVADTGELQTDLVNGGRLDLLIDSIITHLTQIKGAGWSVQTLVAIYDLLSTGFNGISVEDTVYAILAPIFGTGWTDQTLVAIDALLDAIKAKTDNLPASPAEAGEYTAAIGAIPTTPLLAADYTAPDNAGIAAVKAKTDNLPADPADDSDIDAQLAAIKSVIDNIHDTDLPAVKAETALIIEDTGATIPATLGTLATTAHVQEVEDKVDTADAVADAIKAKTDQLTFTVANKVDATTDTSNIAGDVWSHATRTLTNQGVEATYPAGGDPLTIYRDTTVTISLTGLGDSTGDAGTKIFFTAKENLEDADSDSILQLVCTRANPITDPDTDDLLYVNKVAPTAATEGTFVFADHTDGTAVVTVAASAAADLPIYAATPLYWDVKIVTAAGVSTILATGEMYIYGTPTRTVAVT